MDPNIFREYDIRGIVGTQLTDETVATLARALGTFYRKNDAKKIVIGYDARESSPRFCELMKNGLNASGCDVLLIGMVPTPMLYHAVYTMEVDGGVMITGSHNPPDHNGFKICLGKGTLFGAQIQEIKQIAFAGEFAEGTGSVSEENHLNAYCLDVVSNIKMGDRKLKVVVDSGNGMGGVTGIPIFQVLGINMIELFSKPDSTFPNHHPDPTVVENLQHLIRSVREFEADFGIAFDGDGDRIGVVDENGRIIWGDELMVLLSRAVLREKPGSTIIAEVKCSQRLFDDIKAKGGKAVMWKAGHSLIKAKMKETGAALAGEMSGHIFFADRYFGFDDAAYAGARLMELMSKTEGPLSALLSDLPETFSTPELRVDCSDEKKFEVVRRVADEFSKTHEVLTIDGARILFEKGWGLVRASNTQAILVLRFEAETEDDLIEIQQTVEAKVTALIASTAAA
ncbi:MAG: phosphomannomutase/phosphoglucomutase [Acidobacteria bacterium]|nr:phosphomannomutase/phosphoglucomutase [Acidobacteriota bacterium]